MNVTKSGATAIGSTNSIAREKAEAEYADKHEDFSLLLITDEGKSVISKFAKQWGIGEDAKFEYETQYALNIYRKDFSIWIRGFYAS